MHIKRKKINLMRFETTPQVEPQNFGMGFDTVRELKDIAAHYEHVVDIERALGRSWERIQAEDILQRFKPGMIS